MSTRAFREIAAGLDDAIRHAKGEKGRTVDHEVEVSDVDVASVRQRLGMSQAAFARAFGVSTATLRNWEQGRRVPQGPARVLLNVIEREPEAVLRALSAV